MSDQLKTRLILAVLSVAAALLIAVLIAGTATVAGWLLPALKSFSAVAVVACVAVLVPMSFFPSQHALAASGLLIASVVFGITLWLAGFVYTYDQWGVLGIAIGLMLLGIGVVPLAIVAQTLAGAFDVAALLMLGIVLTIAARYYGLHVGSKAARTEYERATKTITIEPNR